MDLAGKTVLLTGASGGLGRRIAECFANAGATMVLSYRHHGAEANMLLKELQAAKLPAHKPNHRVLGFDAADEASVEAAFLALDAPIDVLVNNAGAFPNVDLLQMKAAQWDGVMADNLRSAFLCSREAARLWTEWNRPGVIVNVASIAASFAQEQIDHYSAAKAGMVSLTKNMAARFGPQNIRVNAVSPGVIWRESLQADWPDGVRRWREKAPLGRVVCPKEVAKACLFLACDDSAAITGVNLPVDAGMSSALPF